MSTEMKCIQRIALTFADLNNENVVKQENVCRKAVLNVRKRY